MKDENKTPDKQISPKSIKVRKYLSMALALCMVLCTMVAPAFATDPEPAAEATGLEDVVESLDLVPSLLTTVWNLMTANPLLTLFLGLSLLGIGISVFRKIKRTVRG